jgi:hypothetical protein
MSAIYSLSITDFAHLTTRVCPVRISLPKEHNESLESKDSILNEDFSISTIPKNKVVFIDFPLGDNIDSKKAKELMVQLKSYGIESTQLSSQESSPSKAFNRLQNNLLSCDIVILCCEHIDSYWFNEHLRYYQIIQVYRKSSPMRILIYSSKEPAKLESLKYAKWEKYSNHTTNI